MALLDQFPHTVTIQQRQVEQDEFGGDVESWVDVQDDVEAWVQVLSTSEVKDYEKKGIMCSHAVYFNADPGIDETNQIVYGSQVLEFGSIGEDSVGFDIVWKALVKKRTTQT